MVELFLGKNKRAASGSLLGYFQKSSNQLLGYFQKNSNQLHRKATPYWAKTVTSASGVLTC